jgi:hypothetical protein
VRKTKGKNTPSVVTGVLFSSGGWRRGASRFNYVLAGFVFLEFLSRFVDKIAGRISSIYSKSTRLLWSKLDYIGFEFLLTKGKYTSAFKN